MRARIMRIQLKMAFYLLNGSRNSIPVVLFVAEGAIVARYERRGLIVFRSDPDRFFKRLYRVVGITALEIHSSGIVMDLIQSRIEADCFLELSFCFLVALLEGERKAERGI